jgi:hypothetical protein
MITKEAAAALDGCQYGKEGSKELFAKMKAAGLVAVFGGSDDLAELRGAIYDEVGAYNGTTFYVDQRGIVKNECDAGDECPNWRPRGVAIEALWAPEGEGAGGPSWAYKTEIPHATFKVMEDDDVYCIGIVFRLDQLEPNTFPDDARGD